MDQEPCMPAQSHATATVHASLNFAADRKDGGIWSNMNPATITQALKAHEVLIKDARHLPSPPTLAKEGFEIQHLPMDGKNWTSPEWVAKEYVPKTLELVKRLTGAPLVIPFFNGAALIRDTGDPAKAPAAQFVHIDQTRESTIPFLQMNADEETIKKYPRVQMYNVWRSITPPPQDVPLAICDQRTLDESDWVVGKTVEPQFPNGVPYLASVHNAGQSWYYFSDVTTDESVIFKGYDSDLTVPMGCLHGAFKHPDPDPKAVPRASIEVRFFALFPE